MANSKKAKMTFAQKAFEYKEQVLKLGRHIKVSDHLSFSNKEGMGGWLLNQDRRIESELEKNQELSEEIKKRMEILNDIHSLITISKTLTFEEKAIEYHTKIYEIGRPITKEDHIYFSDQSDMGNWFQNQIVDFRKNARYYPYRYKRRFPILVQLYESIESLNQEKDENYITKNLVDKK